jgi:hypothetical protein
MERIEVDVKTGEVKVIQLTADEIAEAQVQYANWQAEQLVAIASPTVKQLQEQLVDISIQLTALQNKAGA